MSDADLERFVTAQANGEFDTALAEMRAGRKRSHWIWHVFPQIAGLGSSHMSQTYAIRDRDEAVAYLRHPVSPRDSWRSRPRSPIRCGRAPRSTA